MKPPGPVPAHPYWYFCSAYLSVPAIPDLAFLAGGRIWPSPGQQPRWVVILSMHDYVFQVGIFQALHLIDRLLHGLPPAYTFRVRVKQPIFVPSDIPLRIWIDFVQDEITAGTPILYH